MTARKHWFRVADAIQWAPFSNDQIAFLIRLMARLNTRWARDGLDRDQASILEITTADLCSLAGFERVDTSLKTLDSLRQHLSSLSVEVRGMRPCVYFVEAGGLIKIGKSMNLPQRLGQLRKKKAGLKFLGAIETLSHTRLEKALHAEFSDDHVDGEWFRPTERLLTYVRETSDARAMDVPSATSAHPTVIIKWPKWSEFQKLPPGYGNFQGPKLPLPQDAPAPAPSSDPSGRAPPARTGKRKEVPEWLIAHVLGKRRTAEQVAAFRWWLPMARERIEANVRVLVEGGTGNREAFLKTVHRMWRQYQKDPPRHNYAINRKAAEDYERRHERVDLDDVARRMKL